MHARLHTPSRRPPTASAGHPPADQPPARSTAYRARLRPSSRPLVRSGWMSSGATAGRMRLCMRPSHRVQPLLLGRGGKHRATSLGRSAATARSCSRPAPPPSPWSQRPRSPGRLTSDSGHGGGLARVDAMPLRMGGSPGPGRETWRPRARTSRALYRRSCYRYRRHSFFPFLRPSRVELWAQCWCVCVRR